MANHIIIGGTTKAATTSIFRYLSDHPIICASKYKETRFFLDKDYPVRNVPLHFTHSDNYLDLFDCLPDKKWFLEATPDYLYGKNTCQWIYQSISDVKLIFILRNPVDRIKSWYNFSKQNGELSSNVTFSTFLNEQDDKSNFQHFRALDQGNYAKFLKVYFDRFDKSQILVLFYEDIQINPRLEVMKVCAFLKIDPEFFSNYDFEIFNKSRDTRFHFILRFYKRLKQIRKKLINSPIIYKALKRLKLYVFDPVIDLMTKKNTVDEAINLNYDETKRLEGYYSESNKSLRDLLGLKSIPWS